MTRKFHYAWAIAAVTFLVLLTAAGVRSTPSLLMVPLEAEFGWSRALISTAVAINILLFGMIGPFAAGLMDRIGLRRAVTGALVIVSVAVLASSRMSRPWELILYWGLLVGMHGGDVDGALGGGYEPLVFCAPRFGGGNVVGGECDRATDLPAVPGTHH